MKKILMTMMILCLMGCQETDKIEEDDQFELSPYREVGRITSIEKFDSDRIDFGEPTSVVTTLEGVFTIKGVVPTFKRYYPVYMQGDYIFFKNEQGIMKKYELW